MTASPCSARGAPPSDDFSAAPSRAVCDAPAIQAGQGQGRPLVLKHFAGLGNLRQIRGAHLVPGNVMCDCLYDHPAVTHLFKR